MTILVENGKTVLEKKERIDFMLDIETLDPKAGGALFQIALVPFELGKHQSDKLPFNVNISIKDLKELGFSIDKECLLWWLQQEGSTIEKVLGPSYNESALSVREALNQLSLFIKTYRQQYEELAFWGYPATSDLTWLESAYVSMGEENPIKYNETRDMKTILELFWFKFGTKAHVEYSRVKNIKITHRAIEDCEYQIELLDFALMKLGFSFGAKEPQTFGPRPQMPPLQTVPFDPNLETF